MFTYGFLGAIAGLVGAKLAAFNFPLLGAQQGLAILAGVLMLAVGLQNLGVFRIKTADSACIGFGGKMLGHFLSGNGFGASFLAGVFTGFLPCGLVYTFLAFAMSTGDPFRAWLGMVLFGVGTIPALTVLGCGSSMLSKVSRIRLHRLASCFIIVLGVATIVRGIPREEPCCDPDDHVVDRVVNVMVVNVMPDPSHAPVSTSSRASG